MKKKIITVVIGIFLLLTFVVFASGYNKAQPVIQAEIPSMGLPEVPSIDLQISQGPTYSAVDNVYFYRIKAKVYGNPTPTVKFSKDDSLGAWGPKIAQVNLYYAGDSYTLRATATNSVGSDTASITLSWIIEVPPGPPQITFTHVPPYYGSSGEKLEGKVWNVNPADYKVAVYIYLPPMSEYPYAQGWWPKPTWDLALTPINADGTWSCYIGTGGVDYLATEVVAYLFPNGYQPEKYVVYSELPSELDENSIAKVEATR